jgi:hypothetical protein
MRTSLKTILAAALLGGLPAVAAHASTMDLFTFSLVGMPGTGTATLPASPTPSSMVNGVSFTINNLATTYDGTPLSGAVTFLAAGGAEGGGFVFTGPLLFSGTVADPTFNLGTFALHGMPDLGSGPVATTADLSITSMSSPGIPSAATPEPASLALVGTAALGLAGIVRRRLA